MWLLGRDEARRAAKPKRNDTEGQSNRKDTIDLSVVMIERMCVFVCPLRYHQTYVIKRFKYAASVNIQNAL